ncbi:MAG: NlpC/P60 family protein [Acidobacteriota bacterium]
MITREDAIVNSFHAMYNNSLAHRIVGRAIWYMEYGFMKYGKSKGGYAATGFIDCSNFVSLVFRDFGYSLTTCSRNYNAVGTKVMGAEAMLQPGRTTRWMIAGVENLNPGDIFTFWNINSSGVRYISHVAIYMGEIDGNPCVIHTVRRRRTAIGITDNFAFWYGQHFNDARRVLPDSAQEPEGTYTDSGPVIPAMYQITPAYPIVLPEYPEVGI